MDFEKTVERFCDGFCKFPYTCDDEDELRDKCESCPICELVEKLEEKMSQKNKSNFERIKSMNVEKLAEFIYFANDNICFENCKQDTGNKYSCRFGDDLKPENCINCMKIYLESEVEGE